MHSKMMAFDPSDALEAQQQPDCLALFAACTPDLPEWFRSPDQVLPMIFAARKVVETGGGRAAFDAQIGAYAGGHGDLRRIFHKGVVMPEVRARLGDAGDLDPRWTETKKSVQREALKATRQIFRRVKADLTAASVDASRGAICETKVKGLPERVYVHHN